MRTGVGMFLVGALVLVPAIGTAQDFDMDDDQDYSGTGGGPVVDPPIGGPNVEGGAVGDAPIGGPAVEGAPVMDAPIFGPPVGGAAVGDAPIGGPVVDGPSRGPRQSGCDGQANAGTNA